MFSRFSDLTGVDYSEGSIKLARRLADRDGFSNINLLVYPNFNIIMKL
jgi:ubiquinone/menaquinone biosynthesis C-methylase UbiE